MTEESEGRSQIWFPIGLALVLIAAGAFHTWKEFNKRESLAREFAELPADQQNLEVFDAACDLLEQHYYDSAFFTTGKWRNLKSDWRARAQDVESSSLYEKVLDGFARQFPDSHVWFDVPPPLRDSQSPIETDANLEIMRERARSGPGFGAPEIRRGSGRPQVVADVESGSPGERAGVTPGWVLVKHDVEVTAEGAHFFGEFLVLDAESSREVERTGLVPYQSAIAQEQPEAAVGGHTLKLDFELESLPAVPEFETRRLPGDVTYVRFDNFDSLDLVEQALEAIDSASAGGLVVDLRRNPGGRLMHLQRLAGALLGDDTVLGTQRVAKSNSTLYTWRSGGHYPGPLALLIGPSTASAAEITAAAVQDHKRGILIGRTSNGAVVPGEVFNLPDGGLMMVPVSDFVRGDGRRIEGAGVKPDIWVLPSLEDVRAGRDPVLERALRELKTVERTTSR